MIQIFEKSKQAFGQFNNGEILENKPIGFPQDGGDLKPYSNLFYWAHATAIKDSTIGLHPHRGFEIMTIVLEGKINHYDTLLKQWIALESGDVQLIQSGSGISHAESMHKGSKIFQIWFQPNLKNALQKTPGYLDVKKSELPYSDNIRTIVGDQSPVILDAEGIEITLHQVGKKHYDYQVDSNFFYSFYIIDGKLKINQVHVKKDDFFKISEESSVKFEVLQEGRILCIKSPKSTSYPIY